MTIRICFALLTPILIASLLFGGFSCNSADSSSARMIDSVVSTEWLNTNSGTENLVILDIRSIDAYAAGHIPNAINEPFVVPFSAWITMRDDLLLEIPDTADLLAAIGALGITSNSWIVVVTEPNAGEPPYYGLSNATRVAMTLIYAGLEQVAILDGGYPKWVADGFATTTDVPAVTPVTYDIAVNEGIFVNIDYAHEHIGEVTIIDARDADVYFGVTVEPFAAKNGHIPSASCLPAPWIWDENEDETYTYKSIATLQAMASGVVGESKTQEVIVYCGVGGYASSWWYVLTEVLGYNNVKLFDGAAQEWVLQYDMVPYEWD